MDDTPGTNQVAMVERWLLVCPCRRLSVCVSIGLCFHYIYLFIYLFIYWFIHLQIVPSGRDIRVYESYEFYDLQVLISYPIT